MSGEVRSFRAPETAEGPLYAVVHADLEEGSFEAEVVDGAEIGTPSFGTIGRWLSRTRWTPRR